MTSMPTIHALALTSLLALGCAPAPGPDDGDAGNNGTPDAGGNGQFECDYPTTGYGAQTGKKLEPFSLPQCDGTDYHFVNDGFCEAKLTVVSVAAGWCVPCMRESEQLTARITEPYREKGVRVIQILVQDENYDAPTQGFCEDWVAEYGLTNVELMDTIGYTAPYFPSGSLPSTIIVDDKGVIRHKEDGVSEGLNTLRTAIDELLAEQE